MGKGDRRTRRGKIWRGTYGKYRSKKEKVQEQEKQQPEQVEQQEQPEQAEPQEQPE